MSTTLRLGILLVIIFLAWVIIYYQLVAPALVEPEPPPGLALKSGDTVSTKPETEPDHPDHSDHANSSANDPADVNSNESHITDQVPRDNAGNNSDNGNDNGTPNLADSTGGSNEEDPEPEVVLPKPPPTTPYIVKSGDTMESVANSWFGTTSKWLLISQENPFADPRKLKAGITLRLPPKDARLESIPRELYEELTREIRYVISSGDTLSAIAKRFYGKTSLYTLIVEANRDVIKNPDVLQSGVEIIIPRYQQPAE